MGLQRARLVVALAVGVTPSLAKDALVFLGATGDNALRPAGVWQGIFEAFCGGEFDKVGGVDIHVAMNTPHTDSELRADVNKTLSPLLDELKATAGWKCLTQSGDCSAAHFISKIAVNIWEGRDAGAQAQNMSASLRDYGRITVYLSVPPFAFGSWSEAAIKHWGNGTQNRVHIAAEKPFGTSIETADKLHQDILGPGLPEENLHLVDHWLSFFMIRHLLQLRNLVLPRLKMIAGASGKWDSSTFAKVVVTEYETRGLGGRGGFFDKVGQVRDMVQSHLLQVAALSLLDPATTEDNLDAAKVALFEKTSATSCSLGQYDGFLLEPKLTYHPSFADSTLCTVSLAVDTESWRGVPITIATGKAMGTTLYTVEFFQTGGPGVLTFEIGREEVGLGGIKVSNWDVTNTSPFEAPTPGFGGQGTMTATPAVVKGNGFVLNYSSPGLYFPEPYAMMSASLLGRQYTVAFPSYPQCRKSWEIVTSGSTSRCLDPPPAKVMVYKPPETCGHSPPDVCDTGRTVEYLYTDAFACSPEHTAKYRNVSFYAAKCNVTVGGSATIIV